MKSEWDLFPFCAHWCMWQKTWYGWGYISPRYNSCKSTCKWPEKAPADRKCWSRRVGTTLIVRKMMGIYCGMTRDEGLLCRITYQTTFYWHSKVQGLRDDLETRSHAAPWQLHPVASGQEETQTASGIICMFIWNFLKTEISIWQLSVQTSSLTQIYFVCTKKWHI